MGYDRVVEEIRALDPADRDGAAKAYVEEALRAAIVGFELLLRDYTAILSASTLMIECLKHGGKVMFCGNGGSAADSQHLSAELMGRFLRDRHPLPSLALTVDTSVLTAVANDFGVDQMFSRQLRGIGKTGDVLFALSTSGGSRNVIAALETARALGVHTIGLTGEKGDAMAEHCDVLIRAPAGRTPQIQQLHITIGHILCGLVEDALC